MRPSLRFLALAVIGWAGFRVAAASTWPRVRLPSLIADDAKVRPVAPTQLPAIEPVQPVAAAATAQAVPAIQPVPSAPRVRYVHAVIGVPVAMRPGTAMVYQLPPEAPSAAAAAKAVSATEMRIDTRGYTPAAYSFLPTNAGPLSLLSIPAAPVSRPRVASDETVPLLEQRRLKRLQLTSWALLRGQQTGIAGSRSLAPAGQLGASQAGARLLYNFTRQVALSARLSTPVGSRGGEAAAGVRVQPLRNFPVWLTAERRQALGRFGGGRSAFALLIESGVYEQPLPLRFQVDGYVQAGVVSVRNRDLFMDGGFALTRPLWRRVSAGIGVWGGAQPRLGRLDVGPRVSLRVRRNMKLHLDWRQKVVGNARPGSGPALTLAGDF